MIDDETCVRCGAPLRTVEQTPGHRITHHHVCTAKPKLTRHVWGSPDEPLEEGDDAAICGLGYGAILLPVPPGVGTIYHLDFEIFLRGYICKTCGASLEAERLRAAAMGLEHELLVLGDFPRGEISDYSDPVWHPEAIAARNALRVELGLKPFT